MKRIIIAIALAAGLGALTLAAAPARADERWDGRGRVHEEHDRRAYARQYERRHERRVRRDDDRYYGSYEGYPRWR